MTEMEISSSGIIYFNRVAEVNHYSWQGWGLSKYNMSQYRPFFIQFISDFNTGYSAPKPMLDTFEHLPIWFYLNCTDKGERITRDKDGFIERPISHKRLVELARKGSPIQGLSGPHSAIVVTTHASSQYAFVTGIDPDNKIINDVNITRIYNMKATKARMATPLDHSKLLGKYYEKVNTPGF